MLTLLIAAALGLGPGPATTTAAPRPDAAIARLRLRLNPEFPPWAPGHVLDRCAEHLAGVPPADRPRIRYFDLSDQTRGLLPAASAALLFGANSASTAPSVQPVRPVPGTDNRIFWVDLAQLRWPAAIWEAIAAEDPYFREPLVPSDSAGLRFLREQTQSNAVVRGAWFLFYAFDTTQFLAPGQTQADDAFYYRLVYGDATVEVDEPVTVTRQVTETRPVAVTTAYGVRYENRAVSVPRQVVEVRKKKVTRPATPKTAAEFEKFWRVDFALLKDFPVDRGAVVEEGRSAVSYRNRALWRVRTALGTYWRTFDVFRSAGDQDFIENPFPRQFDAGEHIVQDAKGAQHYFLTDGKGNRVEFGDPRVVHDDVSGNPVVLTAAACIHCHDTGIIQPRNELRLLQDLGAKTYAFGPERQERLRQFYLDDGLDRLVKADQEAYTEFVRACNGLTPQETVTSFGRVRQAYAAAVTLDQAAREIGTTADELAAALATATKGRLGQMALDPAATVPRLTWERGGYQEAFLLLIESRKARKMGSNPGR